MIGFIVAVIAFLVLITIVVVVHEGGHFVLAKLSGIRVDEFFVGFGPRVVSFTRGDTEYGIRALPVGGFVRMPGMLGLEGEADAGERNFYRASIPRRLATIAAGVVFNLVFGAICLTVVAAQPSPSYVPSGEPTARAGLVNGDVILSVGGSTISYASTAATDDGFYAAVQRSDGRPTPVVYQGTDGADHTATITPELVVYAEGRSGTFPSKLAGDALVITSVDGTPAGTGDPAAILGSGSPVTVSGFVEGDSTDRFSNDQISDVHDGNGSQTSHVQAAWRIGYGAQVPGDALFPALRDGFGAIPAYASSLIQVIGQLFVHPAQASQQFSGPVGIAAAAGTSVQQGWVQYLSLIGIISLALGFFNVLPIPFLDGGRLLFIAIEAVLRRRIDPVRQAIAIAISLAVIIVLFVLITINDINHLGGGVH
ncbi:MAG: site-2 protease family protein [Candidatus Dormibacteria bacterium]